MTALTVVAGSGGDHGQQDPPLEVFPSPSHPLEVAFALGEDRKLQGIVTLQRWRGSWWEYREPCWYQVEDGAVRGWLYNRLRNVIFEKEGKDGETEEAPWNPGRDKVNNVLDAFSSAVALLPADTEAGTWLPTGQQMSGLVAMPGGLFNVATRQTTDATPKWFTTWSLPYDYEDDAPEPEQWLAFLASIWPDDPETVTMLQEWFGYLVSGRTDLHKAMLLVGPPRCGKGTILRTAAALVGEINNSSPRLQTLTTEFGMQDVIGKTLITVGDARLSGNTSTLVERLLSITGEDAFDINRKYRDHWHGRLGARVMIASNDVPDFRDASGAIGSRFLVGRIVPSFLGREDSELGAKIETELPGILRWALDGLDRLRERGRFSESAESVKMRTTMQEDESPISQFVDDACVIGSHTVPREVLFTAWRTWSEANGHVAGSVVSFGKQLRSAFPQVADQRIGSRESRTRVYTGLGLRRSWVGTDFANSPIEDQKLRVAALAVAVGDD